MKSAPVFHGPVEPIDTLTAKYAAFNIARTTPHLDAKPSLYYAIRDLILWAGAAVALVLAAEALFA